MSRSNDQDEARQREAKAILERIRRETEPQIGAHTQALFLRTRDYMAGRDAEDDDRIEVVGKRIGRWASLAGFVVLAILLARRWAGG